MAARKGVDWEGVERDYSIGILTLREIAEKYGTTEGGIRYKAKQKEWTRDLSKKIEQQVENKLRNEELRKELRTEKAITEREIVDIAAQAQVNVKLSHRKDITQVRGIVKSLLNEIEELNKVKELDNIALRVDCTKKLTETLKTMIDKERQAFGIVDAATPTDNAIAGLLKGLQGNSLTAHTKIDIDDDDE